MKSLPVRFVLSIFRFFAFLLIILGVWQVFSDVTFSMRALPRSGFVIDLIEAESIAGAGVTPVIGFFDAAGSKYIGYLDAVYDPGAFIIAQEVPILYDTANPEIIKLATGFHPVKNGAVSIIIGGGLFFLLGKFSRRPRKLRNPQAGQPSKAPMHALKKRPAPLPSPESAEDHAREVNYKPTVRRMR